MPVGNALGAGAAGLAGGDAYDPKLTMPGRPTPTCGRCASAVSHIPVLAIRGASSDVLPAATLARIQETGAQAVAVPEAGHAPALMDPEQIAAVRRFLAGG
jgi:pimeloyl-ACP methyl ester carboxylesterase